MIGEKKIFPVELLASCRARIEKMNPIVNAIAATCWDRAETEAAAAEQAVMRGDKLGVLHGLPIGIKDLDDAEGVVTTYGSDIFRDHVPDRDEYNVANIRKAGGIVVCKTNVPVFGMGGHTTNEVYGTTRNPFDPTRIAGGSSGGSAAALATSMLPLCTASDSGGSTRMPAAFCGVVGLRQTAGIVPQPSRPMTWSHYPIKGPMARDVADTALLLSAMAGYDPRDPFSPDIDPASWLNPPRVDLSSLKVATSEDLGFALVDRVIRSTFRERVAKFSHVFASQNDDFPENPHGNDVYEIIRSLTTIVYVSKFYDEYGERIGANNITQLEKGYSLTGKEIARAMQAQTEAYHSFHDFFSRYDLLITPSVGVPPHSADDLYLREVDGKPTKHFMHTHGVAYGVTVTGFPSISIPCGLQLGGTPFHLQLVAGKNRDHFLLGVAQSLMEYLSTDPTLARPIPPIPD